LRSPKDLEKQDMFGRQPALEGERVRLRSLAPADCGALYPVAADREVWALYMQRDRSQEPVLRELFEASLASGAAMGVTGKPAERVIGSSRSMSPFLDFGAQRPAGHI
jgi:hypothetical protein